jgi:3-dehydroquinate synthetase
MVAATHIGMVAGLTPPSILDALLNSLTAIGLPTELPSDIAIDDIIALTSRDKKAAAGVARYVIARDFGQMEVHPLSIDVIREGLQRHRSAGGNHV